MWALANGVTVAPRATKNREDALPKGGLRGEGVASFMMDHGRFGPPGVLGGQPGAPNEIVVGRDGEEFRPAHWSKDEDLALRPGDWVQVRTPGGGGYGEA